MNIAGWSVRNRVAVNLFLIAILVGGFLIAGIRLQRDIFPDISTNFIRIITIDSTTSRPEDIEQLITVPIEERLSGITGLNKLISFSQDNLSTVFLEIDPGIPNLDPILNEVRQEVSIARAELPPSAEEPVVEDFDIPLPLLTFGITLPSGFDLTKERALFDRLERDLKAVSGISDVLVAGLGDRELWIEIDPFRLELAKLGFAKIADTISANSRDWTAGHISTASGERVIRLDGAIRAPADLQNLSIPSPNGLIRLRDLASISERPEKATQRGRINQSPALTFTIIKQRGADAINTARTARDIFSNAMQQAPEGVNGLIVSDSTKFINVRIATVLENGIQALVVVTVLLVMLLNWRLAVLIAIGLPFAFAGTFILLYWRGDTLNLLSLFAMIMAIGMVVDDALVISENAYRYHEAGLSRKTAAIRGTQEVILPVLGSVSTTVAAFLPLMLSQGLIGRFLSVVPIVVISALTFSLIQAFIVLPCHMADFLRPPVTIPELERKLRETSGFFQKIPIRSSLIYAEMRKMVDRFLRGTIETYTYLLMVSLRRRYWVSFGFVGLLAGGGALIGLGVLPFQLFDADYTDQIYVKVDLPSNFSLDQTEEVVRRLEQMIVERIPTDDLSALVTQIGARLEETNQFLHRGTNLAMITLDLDDQNPNARRPSAIERDLQNILNHFPEFVSATASSQGGGPPVGLPINIHIQGDSFETLSEIAGILESKLSTIPGVTNLTNDFVAGNPEFIYKADKERAALHGLSGLDIGRALQGAYRGLEAARVRWENDEIRIRVLMDERFQGDPELLAGMKIPAPDGRMIPLSSLTTRSEGSGIARISRLNQRRLISVTGEVDKRITTARKVEAEIRPAVADLENRFPGYKLTFGGESEDTEKSLTSMRNAALLAVLLIYVILAIIFNSFLQPIMVMTVIPFGIIGVIGGLLFMGKPLGLMAIMGTIALAGIVVNNSVVFVDFINRFRKEHPTETVPGKLPSRFNRWRSILSSGRIRFRPIFLTTATTIAGLFTLAFTTHGQEEFLAPMAQAIIFGLFFASLITMILIPCLYAILDDLDFLKIKWKNRRINENPEVSSD